MRNQLKQVVSSIALCQGTQRCESPGEYLAGNDQHGRQWEMLLWLKFYTPQLTYHRNSKFVPLKFCHN